MRQVTVEDFPDQGYRILTPLSFQEITARAAWERGQREARAVLEIEERRAYRRGLVIGAVAALAVAAVAVWRSSR